MTTGWIVGVIVALVIVGGGVWYVIQQPTSEQPTPTVPLIDQQTVSPLSIPAVTALASPTSAAQAPDTATLAAVGPYKGSGTATRSFNGTTFTHTVTASIGDPAAGKFYEGWLVMKTAGGPKFFSTGKLTKKGATYTLTYTAAQNYPDHNDVVITEETLSQGLDGKPEAHVLEGSFK